MSEHRRLERLLFYALVLIVPLLVACGAEPVADLGTDAAGADTALPDTGEVPIYEWDP